MDNEVHSADGLRRGDMAAAEPQTIPGCERITQARLRYRAVASPDFLARRLADGVDRTAPARAPSLLFNNKDQLQARWAARHLDLAAPRIGHRLPSTRALLAATRAGAGWGLTPETLIVPALADGRLQELRPDTPLDITLAWQYARHLGPALGRVPDRRRGHPQGDSVAFGLLTGHTTS